jgi:hypothetical protein
MSTLHADPIQELRHLIIGENDKALDELVDIMHDRERRTRSVSEVLAEAIRQADENGTPLGEVLKHPVEEAVKKTVEESPEIYHGILSPAILPIPGKRFEHLLRSQTRAIWFVAAVLVMLLLVQIMENIGLFAMLGS